MKEDLKKLWEYYTAFTAGFTICNYIAYCCDPVNHPRPIFLTAVILFGIEIFVFIVLGVILIIQCARQS